MRIWIRNRQQRISIPVRRLKTFIEQILLKLKRPDVELGLVLLNDRQIRRLNQKYRGKDTPTDVLSFSLNNASSYQGPLSPPVLLGDVVISLESARRQALDILESSTKVRGPRSPCPWHGPKCRGQAREQGHALYQEVGRLVIHGILHLLGFDHEEARDARRMQRKERELARELLIRTQ